MSFALTVRPEVEQAVIAEAGRRGVPPQDLFDDILRRGLPLPEGPDAGQGVTAALAALKDSSLAVVVVPESAVEALRADEVLAVRARAESA